MTQLGNTDLHPFSEILTKNAMHLRKQPLPHDDDTIILPGMFQALYDSILVERGAEAAAGFVNMVASITKNGFDVKVKHFKRFILNQWVWSELPEHADPSIGKPVVLCGSFGENEADFLKRHMGRRAFIRWHGRDRAYVFACHEDVD